MKLVFCIFFLCAGVLSAQSQAPVNELYDVISKLLTDSTGYENLGDWGVGKPKRYPVQWKADKIEMSNDTSINFYRMGTLSPAIRGKSFAANGKPLQWNIMLKGPRSGYGSFSMISAPDTQLSPKWTIDSLFGNKRYTATLLQKCDDKTLAGYYYYKVKLPRKDVAYIKTSWISLNGKTAIRIDSFDDYSRYAVKLDCPK